MRWREKPPSVRDESSLPTLYDHLTAVAGIVVTVHGHRIERIALSSQRRPGR